MMVLNPVNVIVFAALLYFTLRRFASRTVGLGMTAIAVSVPILLHYAGCGQADVPLMLISGASLFCLLDWMQTREVGRAVARGGADGRRAFHQTRRQGPARSAPVRGSLVRVPGIAEGGAWAGLPRPGCLILVVALGWALPWLLFQLGVKEWSWDYANAGLATVRWHLLPQMLGVLVENEVHFFNQVRLPKWNLLWLIFVFSLLISLVAVAASLELPAAGARAAHGRDRGDHPRFRMGRDVAGTGDHVRAVRGSCSRPCCWSWGTSPRNVGRRGKLRPPPSSGSPALHMTPLTIVGQAGRLSAAWFLALGYEIRSAWPDARGLAMGETGGAKLASHRQMLQNANVKRIRRILCWDLTSLSWTMAARRWRCVASI